MARHTFRLSLTCTVVIERGNIVNCDTDAIVNAANEQMLGGKGVDGAIHQAAGPQLLAECKKVPEVRKGLRCPTGEARITPGGNLRARYVIHTVGPRYAVKGTPAGARGWGRLASKGKAATTKVEAEALLGGAFASCFKLANEHGLRSIALPAVSCGVFRYPVGEAARVSLEAAREQAGTLREIRFCLWTDELVETWRRAAAAMFEEGEAEGVASDAEPAAAEGAAGEAKGGKVPASAAVPGEVAGQRKQPRQPKQTTARGSAARAAGKRRSEAVGTGAAESGAEDEGGRHQRQARPRAE